jgi:hypothetical protein
MRDQGAMVAEEREPVCRQVRLPPLLRVFWAGSAAAFALMVLVGYARFRMGEAPTNCNPLRGVWFDDLVEFLPVYRLLHTAQFFMGIGGSRVAYPPFGAVIYALIYATGHPVAFYVGTAVVWLSAAVWGLRRELLRYGICEVTALLFPLTVALASFPIAGLLQRGNIELFLWILAAMGTWAFLRGHEDAAAALWGLAAAAKLYPIIFLALLLPPKKWRALAVGVGTFVGVTLLSLKWLGPTMGVALRGSVNNVFTYQVKRVGEWSLHELLANHSAFGLVKFVALVVGLPLERLTLPYYACGAAVFAWAFFARLWRMPAANQVLAVTAFMVMLPPVSYFYTLVHLYAPWAMLVMVALRAERAGVRVRGLAFTLLQFLSLFASFMLFTAPHVALFGGLVQAAMLVILFGYAVQYPFAESVGKGPGLG